MSVKYNQLFKIQSVEKALNCPEGTGIKLKLVKGFPIRRIGVNRYYSSLPVISALWIR